MPPESQRSLVGHSTGTVVVHIDTPFDCGWWPPGAGEPGEDWSFEHAELELQWDGGDAIDVLLVTGDGPRALASVPILGIAQVLAQAQVQEHGGPDHD